MKMAKNLVAVIAALSGFIALTALLLLLLGYRPFVLMSGSMEPLYTEGSLCVIDTHVPLDDLTVGDVLVYRTGDFLVLLHLVDVYDATDGVVNAKLQGDTNNIAQDVELSRINYVGRAVFTIPSLGVAVSHTPPALIWSLVAVLIVLACVPWKSLR